MSSVSEHPSMRELLEAEALGALTREESTRLRVHLSGCAECQRELGELRDVVGELGTLRRGAPLDPERSARVRDRLLARAAADRGGAVSLPRRRSGLSRWTGWAVAAGLAALLVTHHAFHQAVAVGWLVAGVLTTVSVGLGAVALWQRDRLMLLRETAGGPGGTVAARARAPLPNAWVAVAALVLLLLGTGWYAGRMRETAGVLRGTIAAVRAERDRAVAALGERERTLAGLVAPSTQVIELAAASEQAPRGRMFWDPATDRWTFFAYGLPPAEPGRTYQLWLLTSDDPVSAGTFTPGGGGEARVEAEYALPPGRLRAVAVTEEPAGGVPAPTGPVVIVGESGE